MKHSFDAFVFDLDGTILDTLPDLVVATNETLEHFGYPTHTRDEILAMVGNGLRALISQALPQGVEESTLDNAVEHWKKVYDEHEHAETAVYDGMMEVIEELKNRGKKVAVLSNKFDGGVKDALNRFMPGLMDYELGEGPVPRKPDPKGLLLTARTLHVSPERIAYVGDSVTDMEVAANAGAFAIGVTWGYQSKERLAEGGADVLVDSPYHLLEFA